MQLEPWMGPKWWNSSSAQLLHSASPLLRWERAQSGFLWLVSDQTPATYSKDLLSSNIKQKVLTLRLENTAQQRVCFILKSRSSPPQHNPKCKRCWPQNHILTWAEKGGETIKKGRDQPAAVLKRQWGKKMIYCFSIQRCLSLKGLRTKRQVSEAACPTGSPFRALKAKAQRA